MLREDEINKLSNGIEENRRCMGLVFEEIDKLRIEVEGKLKEMQEKTEEKWNME